ncbi:hypothetical protein F2P81_013221 [Scophthalmus maximus]|uniref:DUF5641 domain-containing protein n=1 Tax=Scophthalmus maximus TaxID=52904 RepID=A0A6A4SNA6_SCOMX|nr:hypothetical protein F2P81_013221 [Scophthalmus maximus]
MQYGVASHLEILGQAEDLTLRTIRQYTKTLPGSRVSFTIDPASQPTKRFPIHGAFTESCRYKVFVRTHVSEIQELTYHQSWKYVDAQNNPADAVTRGMTLSELAKPKQFSQVGLRVTKTIRSADGKVRTAEVKVDERTYTRPVAKLIELPAIPEYAPARATVDS